MRKPGQAPTVKDVAALARVSPMTVSRVVSGVPTVAPQLRAKVLEAIDKLGYEPNRNASAIRSTSRSGGTVGLCVETIENPFSAAVARGLELSLRPHGHLLFTASSDGEPDSEREVLLEFYRRRVSGLVVMTVRQDHSFLLPNIHRRIPIVYLDRPALLPGCDTVRSNHRDGARVCTAHLIAHGHRNIAFVGANVGGQPIGDRLDGFRVALAEAGIPAEQAVVIDLPHDRTIAQIRIAVRRLFNSDNPPTAVFAASNFDMLAVAQVLHELGRAMDVAHVAFDDIDAADLVTPPLSAYSQDPVELGRLAGDLILRRIVADGPVETKNLVIDGRLFARGSGEIPGPAVAGS